MSEAEQREEALFEAALKLPTSERAAFLDKICAGDADLRVRVDRLLGAFERAGSFLKQSAASGRNVRLTALPIGKAGDRIGRYKLLEQIGEGGCGVVYVAEQEEPVRRRVALKIIKLGMDTKEVIARFEAERQALAMMDHPNIAKVLDAGATETGRPYFVMELVRGVKITEFCDQNELSTTVRLDLFIQVCQAIQHAHQKGIIHRDIKPSNILVASNDGVPVPKVIDFGIAKATEGRLTDQTVYTALEQFIGTPAYMSPEQAQLSMQDVDSRTDIYSLGVLLYELLTGKTPFDAKELVSKGLDEMRRTIREVEPIKPSTRLTREFEAAEAGAQPSSGRNDAKVKAASRRVLQEVRGDLDWIVMKCLEKDRTRRYVTANGLATDIQRHLGNEPVVARPPSNVYRFQKLLRRNRLAFAAASAVTAALVLGSGISTRLFFKEKQARVRAEAAERATQQQLYVALREQARATVRSAELGHRVRALDALQRAAAITNTAELRREIVAALALPDLRFERELVVGGFLQLDPAFERFAIARSNGPVEIRSVADGELLVSLSASTNLPSFVRQWSPDGRCLAVKRDYQGGGLRADWEVWDVAGARRLLVLRDVPYYAVSFHPQRPWLLAQSRAEGLAIWNLENGQVLTRLPQPAAPNLLRFAPEGQRFAAVLERGGNRIVTVHDVNTGAVLASNAFPAAVMALEWHPHGRWLAVPDYGGEVHWMDAQTGETGLMGGHKYEAVNAQFSPEGTYLFTGGWERELICWEARQKRRLFTISLNSYNIQFSADGRRCATLTSTGAKLHAFERPVAHREFAEDLGTRLSVASFAPDGRWLAASGNKCAAVWDLSGDGPGALDSQAYEAQLDFAPDGKEVFANRAVMGNTACFRWRLTPSTNPVAPPGLTRLPLHQPEGFISLSLVSNSVVMVSTNGAQVRAPDQFDLGSDHWKPTIPGISGVSPDRQWIGLYAPFGATLHVHRLPDLEPVAKLTHPAPLAEFRFSPFGDEVAISSGRAGVEFWSTSTWLRTRALTNFIRLLYSADARSLWLTKDFRTAGLYDARTLEPLLMLPTGMLPLALSPDGRRLAVSVDAQRLQLWDLVALREEFRKIGLDWGEH